MEVAQTQCGRCHLEVDRRRDGTCGSLRSHSDGAGTQRAICVQLQGGDAVAIGQRSAVVRHKDAEGGGCGYHCVRDRRAAGTGPVDLHLQGGGGGRGHGAGSVAVRVQQRQREEPGDIIGAWIRQEAPTAAATPATAGKQGQ